MPEQIQHEASEVFQDEIDATHLARKVDSLKEKSKLDRRRYIEEFGEAKDLGVTIEQYRSLIQSGQGR